MQMLLKIAFASASFAIFLTIFMCFDAPASRAGQYGHSPWCAVENDGGRLVWDCEYDSAQDCAPAVTSGNRGFCARNPYLPADDPTRRPQTRDNVNAGSR
jgi:hypothetical protein